MTAFRAHLDALSRSLTVYVNAIKVIPRGHPHSLQLRTWARVLGASPSATTEPFWMETACEEQTHVQGLQMPRGEQPPGGRTGPWRPDPSSWP